MYDPSDTFISLAALGQVRRSYGGAVSMVKLAPPHTCGSSGVFYDAESGGGNVKFPADLLCCFLVHVISVQGLSIYVSDLTEQFSDGAHTFDVHGRFVFGDQMGTDRYLRANVFA